MNEKIDIIIPWVDGSDPVWRREEEQCRERMSIDEHSDSDIRFQSWDNLNYWFRAVETFMPWVNHIFFITWGHLPHFLNIHHPKLKIVKHADYIPPQYLPTYNSNTIEMNYHRIGELSENFILFNDDMFPLQPIDECYYFRDNIVCDEAVENIIAAVEFGPISNMARYTQINNMVIINRYFNKRNVQADNWDKWYCEDYGNLLDRTKSLNYWYDFPGFHDPHMPSAFKKSTLSRLWEIEGDVLDRASRNQFRAYTDVTQYLVRYWQICEGNFYPRRTRGKLCLIDMNNYHDVLAGIRCQKWQMVSLNENCVGESFATVKERINGAFQELLPDKSSYEL